MVLPRTRALWAAAGLVAAALPIASCADWSSCYTTECVPVYYPFYGYYWDCYAVRTGCGVSYADGCNGSDCGGYPRRACKLDDDCEPGKFCGARGACVPRSAWQDAGTDAGAGHAGVDGSLAGSGLDAAVASDAGTTSSGGAPGAGGVPPTGGVSGPVPTIDAAAGAPVGAGAGDGRIRRFNFPCQRDTQCGPGQCVEGECFNACTLDEDCGTADRCSVESGRRLCMPDPNPIVGCQESADCRSDQTCVNGACHDPCEVDTDCANPEDRCLYNLCFPDRRPMAECILNLECSPGLVCLDGRCVELGAL